MNFQKWFNQCIRKDDKIQGDLAEVHGHKIFLHPKRGSKNTPIDPAITGIFDPIETNFLKNTITKGQVIVDVGAGVGEYTILFASMVGKTGKVFAFEPNPDNFNLLKKNFKMNKYNVVLENKALSHINGTSKLYISKWPFMHSLFPSHRSSNNFIRIQSVRLDDYFTNQDVRNKISLIKVDTEGYDFYVLQGANNILDENKDLILQLEFDPTAYKLAGYYPNDLFNFLQDKGFIIYFVDEKQGKIKQVVNFEGLEKRYQQGNLFTNLICSRKPINV